MLDEFLRHCDLAKFARWILFVPQMEEMLQSASAFIVATGKPVAEKDTLPAHLVRASVPAPPPRGSAGCAGFYSFSGPRGIAVGVLRPLTRIRYDPFLYPQWPWLLAFLPLLALLRGRRGRVAAVQYSSFKKLEEQ